MRTPLRLPKQLAWTSSAPSERRWSARFDRVSRSGNSRTPLRPASGDLAGGAKKWPAIRPRTRKRKCIWARLAAFARSTRRICEARIRQGSGSARSAQKSSAHSSSTDWVLHATTETRMLLGRARFCPWTIRSGLSTGRRTDGGVAAGSPNYRGASQRGGSGRGDAPTLDGKGGTQE